FVLQGVHELVQAQAVIADDGVGAEVGAEDGGGDFSYAAGGVGGVQDGVGGAARSGLVLAGGGAGGDRTDGYQRVAGTGVGGGDRHVGELFRHVGSMDCVVGVEQVDHDEGECRVPRQGVVVGALEQQILHLVFDDLDVGAHATDVASGGGDVRVSGGGGFT